jgi:hypothetical protein
MPQFEHLAQPPLYYRLGHRFIVSKGHFCKYFWVLIGSRAVRSISMQQPNVIYPGATLERSRALRPQLNVKTIHVESLPVILLDPWILREDLSNPAFVQR